MVNPYLNETTHHAHIILPPAPPLSRAHYDLVLSAFSVRNIVKFSDPVVPRAPSERHDWEIIAGLAGRVLALRPLRSAPHGIDIGPLDAAPEEFLREARRR